MADANSHHFKLSSFGRRPLHTALWAALPLFVLFLVFGFDRGCSSSRILRGVWLSSTALSGLNRESAASAIRELGERLARRPLSVRVDDAVFEVDPKRVGYRLDVERTLDAAFRRGRAGGIFAQLGWWLSRLGSPDEVAPEAVLDREACEALLLELQSDALSDTPFEGGIRAHGAELVADYPRRGRAIARPVAVERLLAALGSERRQVVDLPTVMVEPRFSRAAVDAALTDAKRIAVAAVELVDEESGKVARFSPEDLALALRALPTANASLTLTFDPALIDSRLGDLRKQLVSPPQDARFVIDERDRVSVVPSRPGTSLDARLVAEALLQAANAPAKVAELPVLRGESPAFVTEDAFALRISGLVSRFTTHHVCCQPRVANIHRIADLLDGRVVRPGEVFSVNAAVGERTLKTGFVMAPSIEDGEMVDAIGGGISQFATTFFNAVFHGGYDIIERQPHSYWFSRYPMGHEATLAWPKPDVIFKNDTDAGVLIDTSYGDTFITVRLFGDNGGRKVRGEVSGRFDIVDPEVELIPDQSLMPDQEKVDESGMVGWSVNVGRHITFADGNVKEEKRKVTYKPRVRRVRVHPCRIPEGEPGHTGEKCPVPETDAAAPPPIVVEPVP